MSYPDSLVYVNVQKGLLFCKGQVQPKSPLKVLFGPKTVAKWPMHCRGYTSIRPPPQQYVRKLRFPSR